jgi:hypothetical protein
MPQVCDEAIALIAKLKGKNKTMNASSHFLKPLRKSLS